MQEPLLCRAPERPATRSPGPMEAPRMTGREGRTTGGMAPSHLVDRDSTSSPGFVAPNAATTRGPLRTGHGGWHGGWHGGLGGSGRRRREGAILGGADLELGSRLRGHDTFLVESSIRPRTKLHKRCSEGGKPNPQTTTLGIQIRWNHLEPVKWFNLFLEMFEQPLFQ